MKRTVIIVLCLLLIGVPLLGVLLGIYPIVFEERITRRDIDNKYVNLDFEGWYEFNLSSDLHFKLPEEWIIAPDEKGESYIITNGKHTIAYITTYGTISSRFSSNKDFLSSCIGEQFATYERKYTGQPLAVASSAFYEVEATTGCGNRIKSFELSLSNGSGDISIIYDNSMEWIEKQELFEISQAIAFSFYY